MNRILALTIVAAAALALPPATASAIPLGEADGITLKRDGNRGLVFHFAPQAAKAFRSIAGRKVKITCTEVQPGNGGYLVSSEMSGSPVPVPKRGRRLPTFDANRGTDLCEIERKGRLFAMVPFTKEGRTYLDEGLTFALMIFPLAVFDEDEATEQPLTIDAAVKRGRGIVVGLDGPEGTPPPGKTGYWTDGIGTAALVRLSSAGRRMFIEYQPDDVVRTNILAYLQEQ